MEKKVGEGSTKKYAEEGGLIKWERGDIKLHTPIP